MSRKDRIAIVISIFLALFSAYVLSFNDKAVGYSVLIIVLCYWSYRFIKNDLSFFKFQDR